MNKIAQRIWDEADKKDRGRWKHELRELKLNLRVDCFQRLVRDLASRFSEQMRFFFSRSVKRLPGQPLFDALVELRALENCYTHVDLLCGTGAFALGFSDALHELGKTAKLLASTVLHLDRDRHAVETCKLNFSGEVLQATLEAGFDTATLPYASVVSCGIPCVEVSAKNQRLVDGVPRQGLTPVTTQVVDALLRLASGPNAPRSFVLECGQNLVRFEKFKPYFNGVLEQFAAAGYAHDHFILNTRDFGLPHNRKRVFIVLIRGSMEHWQRPVATTAPTALRPFTAFLDKPEALAGHTCWLGIHEETGDLEDTPPMPAEPRSVHETFTLWGHNERHPVGRNEWDVITLKEDKRILPCMIGAWGNCRSGRPVVLDTHPDGDLRWRFLTASELARLQGLPSGFRFWQNPMKRISRHMDENGAVTLIGNAVSVPVVRELFLALFHALGAQDGIVQPQLPAVIGQVVEPELDMDLSLLSLSDAVQDEVQEEKSASAFFSSEVAFSSATDDWATPQATFDELNAKWGPFTLDPCASASNHKCARYFTDEQDGLAQDWGAETVFMNPPYGKAIGQWMKKAYESSQQGATVVCLVPVRSDTAWWHDWAKKGEVEFLQGRLRFGGATNSAPFASAVVVFKPDA